jgi:O-antigen ligase
VLLIAFVPVFLGLVNLTVERFVDAPGEVPVEAVDADATLPARGALYVGSVEIAADRFPLGAGLGRYASWMSRIECSPLYEEYGLDAIRGLDCENPIYTTDTFWPQILGEFGAIGLAAYIAFLVAVLYRLWRESGRPEGGALRILRLGAGMVLVQALVESAANAMFHSPPRVYLLFLVVGAVMSIGWRTPASTTASSDPPPAGG